MNVIRNILPATMRAFFLLFCPQFPAEPSPRRKTGKMDHKKLAEQKRVDQLLVDQ
jgi:hypothetical protein